MPPEDPSKRPAAPRSSYVRRPVMMDGLSGRRPEPVSLPPPSTVTPQPVTPVQPTQPLQFTPPPAQKSWRRLAVRGGLAALFVLLLAAGAIAFFRLQSRQNNPELAFTDALTASLSTPKLQVAYTTGEHKSQVLYDLTNLTNPIVSNQATLQLVGADFEIQTYGTAKDTYLSYRKVPDVINARIATMVRDGWIKLRAHGVLPPNATPQLVNLADPRYLAFGPVIVGNYPLEARTQLVNFMQAHKVYDYRPQAVTTKMLDGRKVFVYPVRLNVAYLKIANQSAATNNKFTPTDMQPTVAALDALQGATATLYVTAKTHRLQQVELTKDGETSTMTYSHYNDVVMPDEPQTKLAWSDFARLQTQMEAQVTAASRRGP